MTRQRAAVAVALGLALYAGSARATVLPYVNFQGHLADQNGRPITGTERITFRLLTKAEGGTACLEESQSVPVKAGLFSVLLGGATDGGVGGCTFAQPLYLELQVGADAPMTPRAPLVAAPYAQTAAGLAYGPTADGGMAIMRVGQAGQIPVSDGNLQTGLVANTLGGAGYGDLVSLTNPTDGRERRKVYMLNPYSGCNQPNGLTAAYQTCATQYMSTPGYSAPCQGTPPACPANCIDTSNNHYICSGGCPTGTTDSYGNEILGNCYKRSCECPNILLGYLRAPDPTDGGVTP